MAEPGWVVEHENKVHKNGYSQGEIDCPQAFIEILSDKVPGKQQIWALQIIHKHHECDQNKNHECESNTLASGWDG